MSVLNTWTLCSEWAWYKCEECNKGFPSNHRLSDHIAQQHKPALCNICNKTISNIWELRRHEVYVHKKMNKDTHICDLCPSKQGRNIYSSAETYARHCKNKHSGASEKNWYDPKNSTLKNIYIFEVIHLSLEV